jgi:hypothetical protein
VDTEGADSQKIQAFVEAALNRLLPEVLTSSKQGLRWLGNYFSEGGGRKLIATEVHEELRKVIARRFTKLEEKIESKVKDSGSSLMASIRGNIEGQVLSSIASATHSKEFRDLLQEVTHFSAQKALKDSTGPMLENLREEFKASLMDTLRFAVADIEQNLSGKVKKDVSEFIGHEDFHQAVASEVAKVTSEQDLDAKVMEVMGQKIKTLEEQMSLLNEQIGLLGEQITRLETSASESSGGVPEDLEKHIKKLASEVVNLNWEQRVLPEIGNLAKQAEQAANLKELLNNELFLEKIRLVAAEERREAKAELMAVVREEIEQSGGGVGGSVPTQVIEEVAGRVISESLKDVKALAKRVEPLVAEKVEEVAAGKLGDFLKRGEIGAIIEEDVDRLVSDKFTFVAEMERKLEDLREDFKNIARRAVKESVTAEISDKLTKITSAPEVAGAARDAITQELVHGTIMDEAIQRFLATDEVKEMIDDRFRTIRMFLKNEEIPKVVGKILKEKGLGE